MSVCVSASRRWGRWEEGASVALARRASSRAPPLPGPGHILPPWGCVVVTLGQGHGEAHPYIPQACTEASLPPPLGGTSVFSHRGRPHEVHHPRKVTVQTSAKLEERTREIYGVE